ncbi:MAG: adenylosuccinate synthetase, partial [Patescibacteria group bacterium]
MTKDSKERNLIEKFRLFLWDCFGEEFSRKFKVIAIICLQFGDTGKGKFIHLLAWLWAHIVARTTGGDNAGHTFFHKGKEIILHLLPCGMPFDSKGVINIIGSGVAFYPKAAVDEIKMLLSLGLTCDNLKIALNAKLLLPHHILLDRLGELGAGKEKIGSTGKGIQPCYTDFIARKGLILNDVLNPETFRKKLEHSMKSVQAMLSSHVFFGQKEVKEIMFHSHLENGLYYSEDGILNIEAIIARYVEYGEYLRKYICDTDNFLRNKLGKANILLEGSQGYLLSIDHGTYPYVTSSDCSPAGLAKGAGLRETDIDVSFGIIKGFYETRVGCGPFPT